MNPSEEALVFLRARLCNANFIFNLFSDSPDSNYSKLKYILSSSLTEACNNSVLLLGPRGCGKIPVLELVLQDLLKEYPDMISVIKLSGLLHCDDNCAIKNIVKPVFHGSVNGKLGKLEIARQLCLDHQLVFSKMASYDDNTQFIIDMIGECGLAHKTIVFVLDKFELFAQDKQRLLYSLLDAMQSLTSQAVLIGISCRLDADQLLEKRVRSRFSHRKLLFLPPSKDDLQKILEHILLLPTDSGLPHEYVANFNAKLLSMLVDKKFKEIIDILCSSDSNFNLLTRFLFCVVCHMDLNYGFLSIENFKSALSIIQRQPKLERLKDCSVLELYILVCMKRLDCKEQEICNFNSIMKEYKSINDSLQNPDNYARNVCLRAFEHLLQHELISFLDRRNYIQSIEFRPVELLISWHELRQGLKLHCSCPGVLYKLIENEAEKACDS